MAGVVERIRKTLANRIRFLLVVKDKAMQSESIAKLMPALLKAQKAISAVKKDSKNPHLKNNYASIEAVIEAVKHALNENDIVFIQPLDKVGQSTVVTTRLIHVSGEYLESCLLLSLPKDKDGHDKTDPQSVGSAITYARRYSLCSLLGLSQEDDDGNAASGVGLSDKVVELNNKIGKLVAELKLTKDEARTICKVPNGLPTEVAGLNAAYSLLVAYKESLNG